MGNISTDGLSCTICFAPQGEKMVLQEQHERNRRAVQATSSELSREGALSSLVPWQQPGSPLCLLPSISPTPAGRLLLPSRAFPRAAVIRRWCWAIAEQKDELEVISSSKIWRQAFGRDPGFLLISQAGGRESCSSFHTERAEKGGETFLLELPAASRLLLPWRVSCGHVCGSAGRRGVMNIDHGRTCVKFLFHYTHW